MMWWVLLELEPTLCVTNIIYKWQVFTTVVLQCKFQHADAYISKHIMLIIVSRNVLNYVYHNTHKKLWWPQ